MIVTHEFLAMASEIFSAAKSQVKVSEYLQDSIIRTVQIGESHEDRLRTIDFLVGTGVIVTRDDKFVLVEGQMPDWLIGAASLGLKSAFELSAQLFSSPNMSLKFDQALLIEIGLRGELGFIDYLRKIGGSDLEVTHSSLFDDSLGYDIKVFHPEGLAGFYEVKTSSKPRDGYFDFYISRNEFEKAQSLKDWNLVCMRIEDDKVRFAGRLPWSLMAPKFPLDLDGNIMWQTAKVRVNQDSLEEKLFDQAS